VKTIIAGSRTITDWQILAAAINACPWEITEVVSGGAAGVDTLAEEFAIEMGLRCLVIPAEWKTHGKRAGYMRNEVMLTHARHLLAVWDGASRGTRHTVQRAKQQGAEVFLYEVRGIEVFTEHYFGHEPLLPLRC